jgi:outer membrane receptor protein involved in Fe transport
VQGTPGYGQLLPSCSGAPGTSDGPSAPAGTRLPVTPNFKGNLTARYNWNADAYKMHVQGAVFHQTSATAVLNVSEDQQIGDMPGFTTFDLSYGVARDKWTAELFVKNLFDSRGELNRNSQCFVAECFQNPRIYPTQPQYFGIKFTDRF